MNLPLFIARHIYANEDDKRNVSKPAIRIAIAGVAIGLAVMIVSVCVVLGFKHTIRDKIAGFGSHIVVADFMTLQTGDNYPIQMKDSMVDVLSHIAGVEHVQRYAIKQGILKTDNDFLGVALKGVGPDYDTTFLAQNIVEGTIPKFSDKNSTNKILLSKTIADKLQLHAGDRVFAYFIDKDVRVRRFTVEGIYQTNLSQYDETTCFVDLYTAVKLNAWEPDQVSGAELRVTNFEQMDATANEISRKVNRTIDDYGETFSSKNIREMNQQLFSWLDLLDLNVWIILALMTAVAGITIISGLLIIILERTTMIGLLKALGARNRTIRATFLWFATFIIAQGLLIGDIIGIGLAMLQQKTQLIKLDPQTYHVSAVPIEFNVFLILLLNIATLIICVIFLVGPSYLISIIHPAKSMRYE